MRAKKLCLVLFFSASELGATPFPKPKRSCHRTSRFVSVPPTISVTGGHGDHEGSVKSTARFAEYFGRDTRSGSSPSPRPRGFFFFLFEEEFFSNAPTPDLGCPIMVKPRVRPRGPSVDFDFGSLRLARRHRGEHSCVAKPRTARSRHAYRPLTGEACSDFPRTYLSRDVFFFVFRKKNFSDKSSFFKPLHSQRRATRSPPPRSGLPARMSSSSGR